MPANQVYNATQARTLDTPVRTIAVATGSVVVTPPDGQAFTLQAGQTHTFTPPVAGLTIFSPNSARVNLAYGDDAPTPHEEPVKPKRGRARRRTPAKSTATKRASSRAKRTSTKSSGGSKSGKGKKG